MDFFERQDKARRHTAFLVFYFIVAVVLMIGAVYLAVALISAYQGVSLLANTLRDPDLMLREGRRLERWVDTL